MRVDDRVLYVLIDTPGFQRARRALAWMKERETTAAKRAEVVRQFSDEHRGKGQEALRELEQKCRKQVEDVYEHFTLRRHEQAFELVDEDLFSEDAWLAFGLRRRDLMALGAATGAAGGLAVDVATGGMTLGTGTAAGALGGALGGTLGWFGSARLADVRVLNMPMGGKLLRCGPSKNINLPFVILGRARYLHAMVAGRTHAQRDDLRLEDAGSQADHSNPLPEETRKSLNRHFSDLRRSPDDPDARAMAADSLAELVEPLLADTTSTRSDSKVGQLTDNLERLRSVSGDGISLEAPVERLDTSHSLIYVRAENQKQGGRLRHN